MARDELADLPYAAALRPLAGGLDPDERYDSVHFDKLDLSDPSAANASFLECAFTHVSVQGGRLRRARFSDVWLRDVRLTAIDLAETNWLDGTFIGGVVAGATVFGAQLRRVAFRGCKLDSVNFRGAGLIEVTFEDCLLRHVDFANATLTRTAFPGSRLEQVDLTGVTLDHVDLRGAELGLVIGPDSLRGAIISTAQLAQVAPVIAESLGIVVDPL